ncbi:hypothetical protein RBH29_15505 [Herbivorax sp. ANBcel31]|nr:hypothetical protein [Herbivorax sp. ANBcel31]MDQ2087837.1 hypothetical protein [Herbivorax sp. ANBcel31]
MKKTVKIKILLKKEQIKILQRMSLEYIQSVNALVQSMVDAGK